MGLVTTHESGPQQDLTPDETPPRRFLTVEQVAQELAVSEHQVRALLRSGELRGIQVGGRRLWRIGTPDVEQFIATAYERTAAHIAAGTIDEAAEEQN